MHFGGSTMNVIKVIFVIVMEAISREFRVALPWELLYADDLAVITWPVRKENVVALQRAEMRMVRWMCGVKLKDRLRS